MSRRWSRLLVVLIALAGISAFLALMLTRPRLGRRPRAALAPLVEVVEARPTDVPVVIRSMGAVQAARLVRLVPQVAGRVVKVSQQLIPGGRVKRNEVLVRIDRSDYDLAVREARAAVAEAQLALDVQLGHRAVAKTELKLLEGRLAPSRQGQHLASREAYVENARVQLDAAQSRLEQALLARKRTVLRAPFDARVSEKNVDVGQTVSTQSVLATLVASDEVWVEATLPVDRLRWIELPDKGGSGGASAVVRQKLGGGLETVRRGEVLGLLPGLQDQGKLARLLVRVADPFDPPARSDGRSAAAGGELPLLVGSFVNVEIEGRTLAGLFALPRGALRENGRIWVRGPDGRLAFRAVEVVWSRDETVYVRGALETGEQVVTSRLTAPLPGMEVALAQASRPRARRSSDGGPAESRPRQTSGR